MATLPSRRDGRQAVESKAVNTPRDEDSPTGSGMTRRLAARRRRAYRRRRLGAAALVALLLAVAFAVVHLTGDDHLVADGAGPNPPATSTVVSAATVSPDQTVSTAVTASENTSTAARDPVTTTAPPTNASAPSTTTETAGQAAAATLVRHGPTDRKWIALTFDDNYQGARASNTIKVLKEYDVPATFFIIGHYLDLGPDLGREIAAAGFEVGDHTRSHSNCPTLSKRGLRIEIGNGTDHYRALTGAPTVPLFRPPGGFIDDKTREVAAEKGFKYVVMWDVDTNDWRGRSAAQITETVMANAHNGAIVLMHMAAKHTAEALPAVITRLRDAGYELVPLSKMLSL